MSPWLRMSLARMKTKVDPEYKPKYVLHCNKCSFKRFSDGNDLDDLLEVKVVDLSRGSPKYDPNSKKILNPPVKKRNKMFKCPKCGYTIKAYKTEQKVDKKDE